MEGHECPHCGRPVPASTGRGRRRVWCSDNCRRRAGEARRAAERESRPVKVHEVVRERTLVRSRPLSPDGAIDRVLSDGDATTKLLRVLAHRLRNEPQEDPGDARGWRTDHRALAIADLHNALRTAAAPSMPATTYARGDSVDAQRRAVDAVVRSPRSLREVLRALTQRARRGDLATGEYASVVAACEELLTALAIAGLLRAHRR